MITTMTFLTVFNLMSTAKCTSMHSKPQEVNKIIIHEFAFAKNNVFTITKDSIKITMYTGGQNSKTYLYTKKISANERKMLFESFNNTYLSSIRKSYEDCSGETDDYQYEITIYKTDLCKSIKIYKCEVIQLRKLVDIFNKIIPVRFRISYTTLYTMK